MAQLLSRHIHAVTQFLARLEKGDGAHTLHEHIVVSTLPLRLRFLHGLLRDLAWDKALA